MLCDEFASFGHCWASLNQSHEGVYVGLEGPLHHLIDKGEVCLRLARANVRVNPEAPKSTPHAWLKPTGPFNAVKCVNLKKEWLLFEEVKKVRGDSLSRGQGFIKLLVVH